MGAGEAEAGLLRWLEQARADAVASGELPFLVRAWEVSGSGRSLVAAPGHRPARNGPAVARLAVAVGRGLGVDEVERLESRAEQARAAMGVSLPSRSAAASVRWLRASAAVRLVAAHRARPADLMALAGAGVGLVMLVDDSAVRSRSRDMARVVEAFGWDRPVPEAFERASRLLRAARRAQVGTAAAVGWASSGFDVPAGPGGPSVLSSWRPPSWVDPAAWWAEAPLWRAAGWRPWRVRMVWSGPERPAEPSVEQLRVLAALAGGGEGLLGRVVAAG